MRPLLYSGYPPRESVRRGARFRPPRVTFAVFRLQFWVRTCICLVSHCAEDLRSNASRCCVRGARTRTQQQRRMTFWALMIVFLLRALDQTIVSTAMPRIVSELKGLDLYRMGHDQLPADLDRHGADLGQARRPLRPQADPDHRDLHLRAGSWLCGISGEFGDMPVVGGGMTQLIVFRGIQGIGGGALFTTAFATIADLFPPRERGRVRRSLRRRVRTRQRRSARSSAASSPIMARSTSSACMSRAGAGCSISTCRRR